MTRKVRQYTGLILAQRKALGSDSFQFDPLLPVSFTSIILLAF